MLTFFQLTHSNRSLRLYCMCSWNSKDDGGVVRINQFVTGDISNRQLITSRYNDIEDVAFLVSCQGNMFWWFVADRRSMIGFVCALVGLSK